jgi:hypothetical protein
MPRGREKIPIKINIIYIHHFSFSVELLILLSPISPDRNY